MTAAVVDAGRNGGRPGSRVANPYGDGWPAYATAGWSPLPLPVRAKFPPPAGWTGAGAPYPSRPDCWAWAQENPGGNLGVRLPPGVVGLDVDAYGGKAGAETLAALTDRLGALPPTWTSTSRPGTASGIRVFRAPDGLDWPGQAGPGIDVIHAGLRYVVAAPSVHPEGRRYVWLTPAGTVADELPTPAELPALPAEWIAALTGGRLAGAPKPSAGLDDLAIDAWLTAHEGAGPCSRMTGATDSAVAALVEGADAHHDTAVTAVWRLVHLAADGHPGIRSALAYARRTFTVSIAYRASAADARSEWRRLVVGAVDAAAATDAVDHPDPCPPRSDDVAPPPEDIYEPVDTGPPDDPHEPDEPDSFAVAVAAMRAELLTRDQLADLPPADPIIDGVLNRLTYAVTRGRDTTYKTFVAISQGCAVATGTPWHGHATIPGRVLYLIGEGAYDMDNRITAWEIENKITVPRDMFVTLPRVPNMFRAKELPVLLEIVREGGYLLVVVDTLRRASTGADGNGSDMAEVIDNLDTVKKATANGCVHVIAHTDKADNDSRGYSGIEDDADIVWHAKRDEETGIVGLTNKKMRNGPDGLLLNFLPRDEVPSVTLRLIGEHGRRVPKPADALTHAARKLLNVLRLPGYENGATSPDLIVTSGLSKQRFADAAGELIASGLVTRTGARSQYVYTASPVKSK